MRRTLVRLLGAGVWATVALVVALALGPHDRGLALAAYLALLCALALAALAVAVGAELPLAARALGRARRATRAKPGPVPQLEWLEREVRGAERDAVELHVRFRPLVRQLASAALERRHGVVLERQPERARALVGPHVWELIRDDRPVPGRLEPGLGAGELGVLLDELEAI